MMFIADTAFAVELIALVSGTALLFWAGKEGVFAKIVGYFVIIFAILGMLCTGYFTFRYWEDGYFKSPQMKMGSMSKMGGMMPCMQGGMMGSMQGKSGMRMCDMKLMKQQMQDCPMMKDMMKQMMQQKGKPSVKPDVSSEEHESHHP